ncbi:MAG: hypothetical protein B6230_00065 [Desulfobacteraceae bacterium 4572_89]|nr:MAG: hypothetical protein B6230_00065 [Desulfobacteraceae bacterium 4572_89]
MIKFGQYLSAIASVNGLGDNIEWLFYPGMLQDSWEKWWDDFALRHASHEGVDICFFRTSSDKSSLENKGLAENKDLAKTLERLDKNADIPAMDKGIVLNIADDFLGQTLVLTQDVLAREKLDDFSPKLLFVYSHLEIKKGIVPGCRVEKGQIIGQVFNSNRKPSKLFPHLHLSCIELTGKNPLKNLNWDLFSDRKRVNLINPVFI